MTPGDNEGIASQATHAVRLPARLLDVVEARHRLGVGLTKFYELVGQGELTTVKIGSRRLVSEAAIAAYIERLESAQAQDRAERESAA